MAKKSTPKKPAARPTGLRKPAAPKPSPKQSRPAASKARAAAKTAPPSPPVKAAKPAQRPATPPIPAPIPVQEKPAPVAEAPPSLASLPKTQPLTVSVQTSQGAAAHGNTQLANILVIVTSAGWPVTDLDKNNFTLMEHFDVPGQEAPFSNSITTFRNAGSGAYLLQTRPINGAPWRSGHHLGQILVSSSDDRQGQAAFKLIIR